MQTLVLQHIACEPPAAYETVMRRRGWDITRVELDEGAPIPDWHQFDVIVAMGGPMGVYDSDTHPWLLAELDLIRAAVRAGRPFFGACLGVQLLAGALGGRVYPGPLPEVGVLEVELTAAGRDDPITSGLPPRFPTLQWHQDTFDLPADAVRLATSPAYRNQAMRFGTCAYGVQFHLEVDESMSEDWTHVPAYKESAQRALGAGGFERVLDDFRRHSGEMQAHACRLFERFAVLAETLRADVAISEAKTPTTR
jgi:GMP synthase (glutamine-hydrolysing)